MVEGSHMSQCVFLWFSLHVSRYMHIYWMLVRPVTLRVCEFTIYCQLGLVLQVILLTVQVTQEDILEGSFLPFPWILLECHHSNSDTNPGLLQNSSPIRMEAPWRQEYYLSFPLLCPILILLLHLTGVYFFIIWQKPVYKYLVLFVETNKGINESTPLSSTSRLNLWNCFPTP